MVDNVLYRFKILLEPELGLDGVESVLYEALKSVKKIYSYIVYAKCENQDLQSFIIKYSISDTEAFNTIMVKDAIDDIMNNIYDYWDYYGITKIISYGQPPIDLMVELYNPLVYKLAKRIKNQWRFLELDDLAQTCRVCMVELYNAGYYIHKNLLWVTFKNKVLQELRPMRNEERTVSIYDVIGSPDSDSKDIQIIDTLPDTDAINDEYDKDFHEAEMKVFQELKGIIIDLVGERQFDTLFRDYSRKHTTTTSRKLLIKIKTYLKSLNITRDDFDKKYH